MAKAAKPATAGAEPIVLTIDVGGSHVKILTSAGGEPRRADSGPDLTPQQMVATVKTLAEGLAYDVISMGYPGPVRNNKPSLDPANLKKIKAPAKAQPSISDIGADIVDRFCNQQQQIVEHLQRIPTDVDLMKTIITSPLLGIVTYSLDDAYTILVVHCQRHFLQAKRVTENGGFPN